MSENVTTAIYALTDSMLVIKQIGVAIVCLAVLALFTWLTLKVDSSWVVLSWCLLQRHIVHARFLWR
jgi:hypothetical protein